MFWVELGNIIHHYRAFQRKSKALDVMEGFKYKRNVNRISLQAECGLSLVQPINASCSTHLFKGDSLQTACLLSHSRANTKNRTYPYYRSWAFSLNMSSCTCLRFPKDKLEYLLTSVLRSKLVSLIDFSSWYRLILGTLEKPRHFTFMSQLLFFFFHETKDKIV